MKKPIKPKAADFEATAAKRKHIQKTIEQRLVSGNLAKITEQVTDFAIKHGVSTSDVRITAGTYYNPAKLTAKRLETDTERLARVKEQMLNSYRLKQYEWDREERAREQANREAEYAAQRAARLNGARNGCCKCCGNCK